MIISASKKFIFIHTMKTAGDSIGVALQPYLGQSDFILQNDFQGWWRRTTGKNASTYQTLHKHSTATEVRSLMSADLWESYYKFAFVRHPVDRAVSLYTYIAGKAQQRKRMRPLNAWYLTPQGKKDDPVNWPAMRAFVATDSFSSFLRYPGLSNERGMRPQSDFLCDPDGKIIVDFVGRFENLDVDMAKVQDTLGLPNKSLTRSNTSKENHYGTPKPSADDLDYLSNLFREDFERFGYRI